MLHKTSDDEIQARVGEITQNFCLFGQSVSLAVLADETSILDTDRRLKQVYEAFLCATPLALTGTALDIGAGSGEFSLPFARAFPGWTIWCFEPDTASFARLTRNIAALELSNVKAVNVAIGTENAKPGRKLSAALKSGNLNNIQNLCPTQIFRRSLMRAGHLEPGPANDETFESLEFPTLSARALAELSPSLVKITAPQSEAAILQALGQVEIDHIIGELSDMIPSQVLFSDGMKGQRLAYLPVISTPGELALRRWPEPSNRRAGLDVVVALYNNSDYILECVAGIIENTASDVHALVVDDGSTDGGAALVKKTYAANPRVRVVSKANGGCASARNYGRLMSNATHIAFVDADDVMDSELFPQLLELARYTGCEVVQGGFDLLHMNADGSNYSEDSYEQHAGFKEQLRELVEYFPFAQNNYCVVPAAHLLIGQPTIWRRIYRRDFLDHRNVWFPEHIRAFDDQIFQFLTLYYADTIPSLDHVRYHYRQHSGQDIKQGDERFFYSLEMFRMMVKRGIQEGWNDFSSLARSYANTVNWIHDELRSDLKPKFLEGAAELWVMMRKALGPGELSNVTIKDFNPPDFGYHVTRFETVLQSHNAQYSWIYLDSMTMHAPMMKMTDPSSFKDKEISSSKDPLANMLHKIGGRLLKSTADTAHFPTGPVSLSQQGQVNEDEAAAYLDGIVESRSVGVVGSTDFPFSGTHWFFQRGLDGTWMILNQNNPEYCLAAEDGVLTLRQHKAGVPSRPTRWHLFECAGGFGLCSASGYLLSRSGNAPELVALKIADKAATVWRIQPV